MDGLIDISAARSLVASPLWPRLRDFLWRFAGQIHPSRLSTIPSIPSISSIPSSPRLSRWLLSELKVEPCFHTFPPTDLSRLLLLDSDTLVSISLWLGALSTADALRRVTRGPEVAALKTALPGIYPNLFSYTAYFAKHLPPTSSDPAPSAIRTLGFTLLHSSLSHLPAPLLRRLHLKLPSDAPAPPSNDSTTEQSNDSTIQRLNDPTTLKLLLKLRFPEAHALCFS